MFLTILLYLIESGLIIAVCAFVMFCLYIHHLHRKYDHLPGPRRRSFLFGNLQELAENKAKGIYFPQLTAIWRKIHGPVYVVYLLHKAIIVIAEPAAVKEIGLNPENTKPDSFAKTLGSVFGQRIGGRGLFTETNHEKWSKQRKLFDPAFRRKYLIGLLGIFNDCADKAVDYLNEFADGKTEIRMADVCGRVTLQTIGTSTFGMKEMNVISEPDNYFTKAINNVFHAACLLFHNAFLAEYDPRKSMRVFREDVREGGAFIRKTAKDAIITRMEEVKRGEETVNDILSFILRASQSLKDDLNFGLEEMIDEFVTFFVAGQDTTANLLASCLLCLGRYPHIMKTLRKEVDDVVGDKQHISQHELNKLEYLSLVIKETLRLYGPAGGFHKICGKKFNACGYTIPAGSFVMLSHQAVVSDERFFDDPDTFDPERWRKEDPRRMYAYFPFAIGPRSCIGQNFALMEAKIVLAKLLQNFDISLVPGQSFDVITLITTRPKDGTMCYLTRRT